MLRAQCSRRSVEWLRIPFRRKIQQSERTAEEEHRLEETIAAVDQSYKGLSLKIASSRYRHHFCLTSLRFLSVNTFFCPIFQYSRCSTAMKNIRLIAILLGNIGCTLGWIIDKSCSSGRCSNDDTHATKSLTYPDTYFPIVTEALLSATQRASSAALFIDVDPVNPEVQQLYDYFFIPEGKDRVLCASRICQKEFATRIIKLMVGPAVLKNIEQFNGPSEDKTNPKEVVSAHHLS